LAGPSNPTIKRIFAMSHNLCAHPDCGQPLVEGGTVVGEVCHIKGERPGAARYDENQSDAERHAYENLIGMCRKRVHPWRLSIRTGPYANSSSTSGLTLSMSQTRSVGLRSAATSWITSRRGA
jgi:hypothetical protein